MEVICTGDPLEIVAESLERVCKTLDIACAVIEEKEAHDGEEQRERTSWWSDQRR